MSRMHSELLENVLQVILNKQTEPWKLPQIWQKRKKKDDAPTEKCILVFIKKNVIIISTSVKPSCHH